MSFVVQALSEKCLEVFIDHKETVAFAIIPCGAAGLKHLDVL